MIWVYLTACLSKPTELPPPLIDITSVEKAIDWDAVGAESTKILQEYIQVTQPTPSGMKHEGLSF